MGQKCARGEAVPLIRLHFLVEGQTEETFVDRILKQELAANNIYADVKMVTTKRTPHQVFRGGGRNYERWAGDLTRWMKQDQASDSWFTTMFDLYGLPQNFPGRTDPALPSGGSASALHLQNCLAADIRNRLGGLPVADRLIPYIQVHEFEALLFSEPEAFRTVFPDNPRLASKIAAIRQLFMTPEEINSGQHTAPSKRIIAACPDYDKVTYGVLLAEQTGLASFRKQCPHFAAWFESLLRL